MTVVIYEPSSIKYKKPKFKISLEFMETKNGSSNTTSFNQDGFQIKLSITDTELIIHAENMVSLRTYWSKFNNGAVRKVTGRFFVDVYMMYHGLKEAFEKTSKDVTIKLDEQAKISYVHLVSIGVLKREFEFEIELEEEMIELSALREKQYTKVQSTVTKHEAILPKIEETLQNILVKLDQIDKRLTKVEKKFESKLIVPKFKTGDPNFILSNENRTAQMANWNKQTRLLAESPFPKNEKVMFSVKIERTTSKKLNIGILGTQNLFYLACEIGIIFLNKSIPLMEFSHPNGKTQLYAYASSDASNISINSGDILSFYCDLCFGNVVLFINNKEVYKGRSEGMVVQSGKYDIYPFVDFSSNNDCVSFVETEVSA